VRQWHRSCNVENAVSEGELDRDALPGHRLADRYLIEQLVARGGMARVYRARDERLDRPVAIKILSSPYANDPAYVRRFLEEARIAASITHHNLAHVYDSGEDAGAQFIVLELLEGYRSLRDEIEEHGRLDAERSVEVAEAVLAGLAQLHAQGLIHCDVKAGNVLLGRDGVKLIDFGIARPLNDQSVGPTSIGSLHSMSPEQLRGEPLTAASDLFSVAVVLYQSLTGRVPFPGETPAAVAQAHLAGLRAAPSELVPGIPDMVDAVVAEALEIDPARRFTSAEAMTTALKAAAASLRHAEPAAVVAPDDDTTSFVPVVTPAPPSAGGTPAPPARGTSRRPPGARTAVVAGLSLMAGAALVVGVLMLNGLVGGRQPADASTGTPTPLETQAPPANTVKVPNTIGMSETEAEAAAKEAGLTWRLEWQVDPTKQPGVYDQEPAAGTQVENGARFVMYAYRTR
jgi:serine/threonine-protein kinase